MSFPPSGTAAPLSRRRGGRARTRRRCAYWWFVDDQQGHRWRDARRCRHRRSPDARWLRAADARAQRLGRGVLHHRRALSAVSDQGRAAGCPDAAIVRARAPLRQGRGIARRIRPQLPGPFPGRDPQSPHRVGVAAARRPSPSSRETKAVRSEVHESLQHLLERGQRDSSVRDHATTADIIIFGAMIAQPLPTISAQDAPFPPRTRWRADSNRFTSTASPPRRPGPRPLLAVRRAPPDPGHSRLSKGSARSRSSAVASQAEKPVPMYDPP